MNLPTTALVIDDDHHITAVVRWALEKAGIRALIAHNALDGLAIARRALPSVIVMDVYLPGMDGGLLAELLKESEGLQKIPVILMSAMPEEELRNRGRECGAFSFLAKPLSLKMLVLEVERCVQERGSSRRLRKTS